MKRVKSFDLTLDMRKKGNGTTPREVAPSSLSFCLRVSPTDPADLHLRRPADRGSPEVHSFTVASGAPSGSANFTWTDCYSVIGRFCPPCVIIVKVRTICQAFTKIFVRNHRTPPLDAGKAPLRYRQLSTNRQNQESMR